MRQFAIIVTNQFQLEELPYKVLLGLFLRKCVEFLGEILEMCFTFSILNHCVLQWDVREQGFLLAMCFLTIRCC